MPPGEDFLRDLDGNPVTDAEGNALSVEPGTTIREATDDGVVTHSDGTPVIDRYGEWRDTDRCRNKG